MDGFGKFLLLDGFDRFLLYILVLGFSILASVVANGISRDPTAFRSIKAAKKLVFFSYAIVILVGAVAIAELATFNFNEWIYMKTSFYLFTWLLPIYIFVDLENHKVLDIAIEMAVMILSVFLLVTAIYGFCYL